MTQLRIPKKPPERITRAAAYLGEACAACGWTGSVFVNMHRCTPYLLHNMTDGDDEMFEHVEGDWYKLVDKEGGR